MMTGRRIILRGFRLDKDGNRIVRSQKHLDVSTRIKQRTSKRVRIVKRGTLTCK